MEVPPEVWEMIFEYLTAKDACIMSRVCWFWHSLLNRSTLWKHFHSRDLGFSPQPPLKPDDWKKSYGKISVNIARNSCLPLVRLNEFRDFVKIDWKFIRAILNGADVVVKKMFRTLEIAPRYYPFYIIHSAASGNLKVLKALLEEMKVSLETIRSAHGNDMVTIACSRKNNLDILSFLFENGFESPAHILQKVVAGKDLQAVKKLCENGAHVDMSVFKSALKNSFKILKFFLTSPSVRKDMLEFMNWAFLEVMLSTSRLDSQKRLEATKLLVDMGAVMASPCRALKHYLDLPDFDQYDFEVDLIFQAIQNEFESHPADGSYFVTMAAMRGENKGVEIIRRMQKHCLLIDQQVYEQKLKVRITPLQYAAFHGNYQLAKNLLECGADVKVTLQQPSALYYAHQFGHQDIVNLIKEYTSGKKGKKRKKKEKKETEKEKPKTKKRGSKVKKQKKEI